MWKLIVNFFYSRFVTQESSWQSAILSYDDLCVLIEKSHHKQQSKQRQHRNVMSPYLWFQRVTINMPNEVGSYSVDMCKVKEYASMPQQSALPLVWTSKGLADGGHRLYAAILRGDKQLVLFIPVSSDSSKIRL